MKDEILREKWAVLAGSVYQVRNDLEGTVLYDMEQEARWVLHKEIVVRMMGLNKDLLENLAKIGKL